MAHPRRKLRSVPSLVLLLGMAACGGSPSALQGAQPPAGSAPGCEDPEEAYETDPCGTQEDDDAGRRPVPDVSRSPRGSAPNVGDEEEGTAPTSQGSRDPVPNLGGPAPEGDAPGFDEEEDDDDD